MRIDCEILRVCFCCELDLTIPPFNHLTNQPFNHMKKQPEGQI